jgi:hypothetical protein
MRSILAFAVIMIALAAAAPKLLRSIGTSPTTTAQATAERPDPSYPRTASIPRGANGHFEADAYVDGRRIGFMIDTGASVIALRQQDAARLYVALLKAYPHHVVDVSWLPADKQKMIEIFKISWLGNDEMRKAALVFNPVLVRCPSTLRFPKTIRL